MVNDVRVARFKDQITETLAQGGLELFQSLLEDYEREKNVPMLEIASALARMARGDVPLLLEKPRREPPAEPFAADAPPHYFRMMKELAMLGFFTSEVGYTKAMRYVESPGKYEPCAPYTAGETAWAPHA